MYLPRTLEKSIETASRQFPALLVTGARQVGKTTLLRHLCGEHRTYVTLDDPLLLSLARQDPALFLQRFRPPVLIDEIQYAPGLLPLIKMEIDRDKAPGAFWMTGSQQFHLMKGVSESLAGRVAVLELLPLSHREMNLLPDEPFVPTKDVVAKRGQDSRPLSLQDLYRRIWRGGFPGVALDETIGRDLYFGSFVQTYLQRDIRDLARVGDETAFLRFLRASAARTAQLTNLSELAREADIAVNTAKSWLSILLASGIVFLLEPWHSNLTKRLVKTPKLYFLDTGLCSYLTGWTSPETLEAGAMSGAILESWVITEILKSYLHNGLRPSFFYYRDKDRKEVDLLIEQDGRLYPLEIKKSASPSGNDVRHFKAFASSCSATGHGGLISLYPEALPLTTEVELIPVAYL